MKKRILFVVIGLFILVASLSGMKALQIRAMIQQAKIALPPPATVTAAPVSAATWVESLTAVGTLSAVQGVTVSAELAGKVVGIQFASGSAVRKGDILVRQDTTSEEAQLPGAVSAADLARINLDRADAMIQEKIISQLDHDTAVATLDQARSQVKSIRTTIEKKTIRAPFSGRLGVRLVNLGQVLKEGDPIVTLQALNPILVDFNLPQQQVAQVKVGQVVTVTCDALPGQSVEGRVTAISPLVDENTRNIRVQATAGNPLEALRPGMFVNVAVTLPEEHQVQAIPATAVLYAPYSDSVFVIEDGKDGKTKTLRQQFVHIGEKRGDLVAVQTGLKPGETVVSTGVFKLRNGQPVVVDNSLAPNFQIAPKPENN